MYSRNYNDRSNNIILFYPRDYYSLYFITIYLFSIIHYLISRFTKEMALRKLHRLQTFLPVSVEYFNLNECLNSQSETSQ